MSVQAISWVIENSKHKLGNLVVLMMVANHARSDGTGAWPSVNTLAKESRMSERGVRYCLRLLEKSGELVTEIGTGPHGCNLYSIPGAKSSGGKKMQEGGQNPTGKVLKIAPEPSFKPSLKQPKPRLQNRQARNRFDEEMEQRRRVEAQRKREAGEASVRAELRVGAGPSYR